MTKSSSSQLLLVHTAQLVSILTGFEIMGMNDCGLDGRPDKTQGVLLLTWMVDPARNPNERVLPLDPDDASTEEMTVAGGPLEEQYGVLISNTVLLRAHAVCLGLYTWLNVDTLPGVGTSGPRAV